MISCKKATELLTIREDRTLSQAERFQLRLHLGACSLCRNYSQTDLHDHKINQAIERIEKDNYERREEKRTH